MWTLLRIMGLLGLAAAVLIVVGLVMMIIVAFEYGIDRENGLGFGLIAVAILIGALKRHDIIWLLRYGLTGERRRSSK